MAWCWLPLQLGVIVWLRSPETIVTMRAGVHEHGAMKALRAAYLLHQMQGSKRGRVRLPKPQRKKPGRVFQAKGNEKVMPALSHIPDYPHEPSHNESKP